MFLAAMEGRSQAAKRQRELLLWTAWHVESFAREKRLKGFAKYLGGDEKAPPVKAQTAPEMLEAMRAWVNHTRH